MRTVDRAASAEAACPICGAGARPAIEVGRATYYACLVCDTHFQHPMPTIDAMRSYVEAEYATGVYKDYVAAGRLKALTFARRARAIARRSGGGRLLDVGASCGFFVEQALAAGFDAYGLELSSEAVAQAPAALRERLTVGDVNTLRLDGATFDVITAFDLIEHVFNPIAFLRSLRSIVRPGTWIAIATPDTGHVLRQLLGKGWPMYQPMQHTVLFSRRGLRLALSLAGFESIEIGPAYKTLTADYLAGQVQMYVPAAVGAYRAVARFVPARLREAPLNVNIGELMAFARASEP